MKPGDIVEILKDVPTIKARVVYIYQSLNVFVDFDFDPVYLSLARERYVLHNGESNNLFSPLPNRTGYWFTMKEISLCKEVSDFDHLENIYI